MPIDVANEETIVRGIFHPFHIRGTKLHWNAFRPPAGRIDVSVIRHDYLGAVQCRARAQEIAGEGKEYRGLASLQVKTVREAGPDVVDSRSQFLGHADIMHIYVVQAGEPPESEAFDALRETCKRLAGAAVFTPDTATS